MPPRSWLTAGVLTDEEEITCGCISGGMKWRRLADWTGRVDSYLWLARRKREIFFSFFCIESHCFSWTGRRHWNSVEHFHRVLHVINAFGLQKKSLFFDFFFFQMSGFYLSDCILLFCATHTILCFKRGLCNSSLSSLFMLRLVRLIKKKKKKNLMEDDKLMFFFSLL